MRQRAEVKLTAEQRKELIKMTKSGRHGASEINHAEILLALDESEGQRYTQQEVAAQTRVNVATVAKISSRFLEGGIEQAIYRKKRITPPVAPKFTGEVEARIVKLACSAPPQGRSRWTLQLLADESVRLNIVDSASDNGIRLLLKKHNLNLT